MYYSHVSSLSFFAIKYLILDLHGIKDIKIFLKYVLFHIMSKIQVLKKNSQETLKKTYLVFPESRQLSQEQLFGHSQKG